MYAINPQSADHEHRDFVTKSMTKAQPVAQVHSVQARRWIYIKAIKAVRKSYCVSLAKFT